jgi:gliding motility-associated-like protein
MKIWIRNIGLFILLLLAGRMAAQGPVLDSVCSGAVRHYRVDGEAGSTYSWILTPPSGPVVILPSDADTLEIAWSYPAGTYELKCIQHALNGCDADAVSGQIIVIGQPDVFAGPSDMICIGYYYKLADATAQNCSSLLWETNGDGTFDDSTYLNATYSPGTNDILNGSVILTLIGNGLIHDGGCNPSISSMELFIVEEIVPQFEPIGPLCQFSIPPALPDTALDGMPGTWSPPVIDTDILGTFPYTFDPDDPTGCYVDTTILITITDEIVPQFDPIGPLCINSAPPALPDTSLEGITGTWLPAVINTNTPGVFIYTFTPDDPSQCGVETTMPIAIVTEIVPQFDPIGPLCQYSIPPALPDTSLNDIAGTWNPLAIITDVPGSYTFTFTPYPDQCGVDTTIEITVLPQVTPVFDTIGPLCQYSASPPLPDTSLNGVTGYWTPAWINTTNPGTFTYTFTPDDPGQCAIIATMNITIIPEITPEFEPIGPLCQFSPAPALPDTSLNGISGTWNPQVISTDVTGAFFFTFTPDPVYICVLPVTISVSVVTDIIPVFDSIGPLCQFSAPPALPDTSLNGITGTWVPPIINTDVTGTFIFTFSPNDPAQCGVATTIYITVVSEIHPEFDPIGPLCQNSVPPALPDTSKNGITGAWDPPVISTGTTGTFTYIFTPDNPDQCAVEANMDISVVTGLTPEFDPIGPLCQFSSPPVLPTTSLNGISGAWTPPAPDTGIPGITIHTFTPDEGQCAVTSLMNIEITGIPVVAEVVISAPHCSHPDGEIVISAFSPSGFTLEYSVDDGNSYFSAGTFDSLSAGVYIVRIKDQNGCEGYYAGNPVVLEDIPGPQVLQVLVTDETDGLDNGALQIIASGGTGQLFYSIDGGNNWQTDNGFFNTLSEGIYSCVVRDEFECDTTFTIEIRNIIITHTYLQAITGEGNHCLGNAAIVPLEVDKFIDVASFQLKLSYNSDNLSCQGYININPQLEVNLLCWADQLAGEITVQWRDTVPVTFSQKETIIELVFITKHSGQGEIEWYTAATDSYFANLAGEPIPAEFYAEQLNIYDPPVILLAESKTVCEGDKVTIPGIASTTYPPVSYQWTYPDGQIHTSDPFFAGVTYDDAGDYTLYVIDSMGCSDQKTIRLIVSENPVAAFHGTDTLRVPEGHIVDAGYGMASYLWNTGETTESITVSAEGWVRVEMITHVGCYGIDSVYIVILTEEIPAECLFIPNAFTPDNDGMNDTFKAYSACEISFFRMQIYTRWGEKLFESADISTGWDGKKNGELCPGDVYVYKISYRLEGIPDNALDTVITGAVLILR